ncbi:hypothetical protein N7520_000132 [Penicillium odoratum]|uniref:uncharacterized protein n=1 Tax=Penicillium odoratum TaxID=1167516 RepID=UPI002548A685|nr:uncharacterized protein N7520_000132 [Penicillium odoratum]KAJ5776886.1 hypothetical protein N7520_000132 [Penicillium odoratum]
MASSTSTPSAGEANPAGSSSQRNLKAADRLVDSLFLNPEYSDMEIICGSRTFQAHRVIVCSRSDWFKKACGSEFKEASGKIKLPDKDAILIEVVLEFLYKNEYTVDGMAQDTCTPADENSPLTNQFGTKKRKPKFNAKESPSKRQKPAAMNFYVPEEDKTPEMTKDVNLDAEPWSTNWPPLSKCPASYFHARVFAEADYFMIEELKQAAKSKFNKSLYACDTTWRLELLILELWSQRADYGELRSILMKFVTMQMGTMHKVFIQLDRKFLEAVPRFTADFAWDYIEWQRENSKDTRKE